MGNLEDSYLLIAFLTLFIVYSLLKRLTLYFEGVVGVGLCEFESHRPHKEDDQNGHPLCFL